MKRQDPETGISYAHYTSNPVKARLRAGVTVPKSEGGNRTATQGFACIKIDLECGHCYAASVNKLFGTGLDFTRENLDRVEFYVDQREFKKWRNLQRKITASLDVTERPRIFIGDMLDLCLGSPEDDDRDGMPLALKCEGREDPQPGIPYKWLWYIIKEIESCPDIDFLLLTKRPKRLRLFYKWMDTRLPANLHIGVTCGHQGAIHRVETLISIPAAKHWISVEPMLGPLNLTRVDYSAELRKHLIASSKINGLIVTEAGAMKEFPDGSSFKNYLTGRYDDGWDQGDLVGKIDTVVLGGESGGKPRPFEWEWVRSLVNDCKASGTAVWVKQGGGVHPPKKLADFPEDLRIRQWGGSR